MRSPSRPSRARAARPRPSVGPALEHVRRPRSSPSGSAAIAARRAALGVVEDLVHAREQRARARAVRPARATRLSPVRLAARWARRSARRSAGFRIRSASSRSVLVGRAASAGSRRPPPRACVESDGHPARGRAADVGVVRAAGGEADQPVAVEAAARSA